jgi:hypothetical protein
VLLPNQSVIVNGVAYSPRGGWVSGVNGFQEPTTTAFEMANLVGVIGDMQIQNAVTFTSLELPLLEVVTGTIQFENSASMTVLDISALKAVGGNLDFTNCADSAIDLADLVFCGGSLDLYGMGSATSIDLGSLETVGGEIAIGSVTSLVSFALPSLLKVGGNCDFSGNALNQTSVDGLLVKLASLNGTGGTTSYDNWMVNLSGGTNASPSGSGLTAKATLEGRGNTVMVN